MKNIGYTLKRYKIWVIAIIIVILAIVSLTKSKTIEDYFLSNYESAREILYHDNFSVNY